MKIEALAFLLLATSACAIGKGVKPVYMNQGVQVYEAKCNGLARTMNDCYAQASEQCNGNFKALQHDGSQAYVNTGNAYTGASWTPITNRSLAFTCD